uniref:Uncharacterized protein n=1 Tax=Setaria viridis TaxID=4556 RepID=A0A4U6WDQ4_SETVI|nr:hypothetical protein SEVIR_1G261600v2 [Setaria viridis]
MEEALDSVSLEEVASNSLPPDSFVPDSFAAVSFVPDSLPPESQAAVSFVPHSLPSESQPSTCVCCGTTHDCDDVEGCRLARHFDYDLAARIMDDIDKFDCDIYIPNVKTLQMDGDTILVPEHVLKKLDELWKMKQDARKEQ